MRRRLLIALVIALLAVPVVADWPLVFWGGVTRRYVDATLGSDSNPGTQGSPWKTLAKVTAAAKPGTKVYLKRGETWREQFILPANCYIGAYGTGTKPIISGADLLDNASFSKTSGRTYVYEISLPSIPVAVNPYTPINNNNVLMVWEDDARMGTSYVGSLGGIGTFIDSIAACDATAGTFYWDSAAKILYIHPADDDSPITNGKVYEASVRTLAIAGGDGVTVENLIAEKNYSVSTAVQQGYPILGYRSGTYRYCVARKGFGHLMGVANQEAGTILFDHCLAEDAEEASVFVAFADGPDMMHVTFRNCTARNPTKRYSASLQDSGGESHGPSATCTLENCQFENFYIGFYVGSEATPTFVGTTTIKGCFVGVRVDDTPNQTYDHFILDDIGYLGFNLNGDCRGSAFTNLKAVNFAAGATPISMLSVPYAATPIVISDSIFANQSIPNYAAAIINHGTADRALPVLLRNSFYKWWAALDGHSPISSDYNNFYGSTFLWADSELAPGTFSTLIAWQTASSMDANSTATDPAYVPGFFTVTVTDPSGT